MADLQASSATPKDNTTTPKPSTPIGKQFSSEPITPLPKASATRFAATTSSTPIVKKLASDITPKKLLTHVRMDPALKEELAMSDLVDVPGLVEYLFPDKSLPLSSDVLSTAVKKRLYSARTQKWKGCPDLSKHSSSGIEEEALAKFLNNFGEELANIFKSKGGHLRAPRRRWHSKQCNIPLGGGPTAKRKPDLILAEESVKDVTWFDAMIHGELKSKVKDTTEAYNQLVNGAYMVFSSQGGRRFHIGISFCLYMVRVYVFDRAGVVGSESIDMHSEPDTFVRLMAGLMFANISSLGYDPTIVHELDGRRYITVDNKKYGIIEAVFISDAIRGRGTVCWRVRREGVEYVIKDLWADISRGHTEAEVLERARGIEGVSQIVAEEIVQVDGEDDTTARIRAIIDRKNYYRADWLDQLEVRNHRRIVMTPFAVGLTHFSTKKELISVFIDAIKTHRRLVEMQILHRDISLHNIMMYRATPSNDTKAANLDGSDDEAVEGDVRTEKGESRLRKGLIIDLDYAIFMEEEDRDVATGHRTGTLPFMAIAMLWGEQKHEPRHDLESFFYVLLWICWHYAGPNNTERQNFDIMKTGARGWLGGESFEAMGTEKCEKMMTDAMAFDRGTLKLFAPYFQDLKVCVTRLRKRIFEDYGKKDVGHQEILDILEETRQTLPDKEDWSWEMDKEGYGGRPVAGTKRKYEANMPDILEGNEEEEEVREPPRASIGKRARTMDVNRPVTRSRTRVPDYLSERTRRPRRS